jgi:hypothetical protein
MAKPRTPVGQFDPTGYEAEAEAEADAPTTTNTGAPIPVPSPQSLTPERPEIIAGPLARGLQSALIGQAFESFGKAFNGGGYTPVGQAVQPTPGMANWRNAGQQVQKALEARWYQAELKNFRNAELKEMQTNMQGLIEESKFHNKELNRGRWHEAGPEGEVTILDLSTEEGRLQQVELRGQLQADMINRVGEMQIALGNAAAEKYRMNPLINKMVADLYKHTSNSLVTQFNPQAAQKTAESMSGLRVDEAKIRQMDAQGRASDAQAKAAGTKDPTGLRAAYDQGGAGRLDEFINGTDSGNSLWMQNRDRYDERVKQDFYRKWRATKGKKVTVNAQAKMEADFDKNQDRLTKLGQYHWIKDTLGEEVANEFSKANPGYGPEDEGPVDFAVKGAVEPKAAKQKAEKFAGIALDKYAEWMAEQDPEEAGFEDGVDFIMKEWLPAALAGTLDPTVEVHAEYISDNLTAGETKATAEYRALVRSKILAQLESKAGSGKGGKGLKEHQKAPKAPRGPKGGLTRAVKGLFGDDTYSEEAPPQPSEPTI